MKLVALTSAALLAATTAFAGSYNTTVTPDVPVVVETPAPAAAGGSGSGGSASWLIPVVALVAIGGVLVACQDDEDK